MTRQVSDKLIYEGEQYPMLSSIYLPENDARVVELTDEEYKSLFGDGDEVRKANLKKVNDEIDAKLKANEKLIGEAHYTLTDDDRERLEKYTYRCPAYYTSSTACWRRYIATWEINEGVLYLSGIVGRYKLLSDEPIIADWYSNTLKIGLGDQLGHNMIMASGDIYEKENHILIEKGIVISTEVIDGDKDSLSPLDKLLNGDFDRGKKLREFIDEDD